jgi:hypothetical protein
LGLYIYIYIYCFIFHTWQALVSWTYYKISYQLGTEIRSKADFCLVCGRYEPGIWGRHKLDINLPVSYPTGIGMRLVYSFNVWSLVGWDLSGVPYYWLIHITTTFSVVGSCRKWNWKNPKWNPTDGVPNTDALVIMASRVFFRWRNIAIFRQRSWEKNVFQV